MYQSVKFSIKKDGLALIRIMRTVKVVCIKVYNSGNKVVFALIGTKRPVKGCLLKCKIYRKKSSLPQ